jgi:hypothetical protein
VLSAVWSPGSTTVWVLASGTASVTGALWAVTVGGAATGPVGVGDNAAAAVVAPSGATVWVLDTGTGAAGDHSGGVVPVETATGTAGTRLPTHTDAQALAVVP